MPPSNVPSSESELEPTINNHRPDFLARESGCGDVVISPAKKQQRHQPALPILNVSPRNNAPNNLQNNILFDGSEQQSPPQESSIVGVVTIQKQSLSPQLDEDKSTVTAGSASCGVFGLVRQSSSVFESVRRGSVANNGNSSRANHPRGKSRRDYQFHNLLGEGALGKVYRASRVDSHMSDEEVAIKVVKKSRILHSPLLCQMVREEVRILSRPEIIRNPYIVTLKSSFQDEGFLYYIFEYVDGYTLGKAIERLSQFRDCPIVPMDLVRLWIAELLYVVWTLGREQIVHRDLKPENIILSQGHIKVLDFNNALIVTDLSPESVYTGGFTNRFFTSNNKNNSFPASPRATEIDPDFSNVCQHSSALSNPPPLTFGVDYNNIHERVTGPFEGGITDNGIAESSPPPSGFDPITDFGGTLPYWAPERVSLYVNGAGSVKSLTSVSSNLDGSKRRSGSTGKNSVSSSCIGIEFDVWSVGCLMFEMMTGVNPFLRQTPELTADAILRYSSGEISLHFPSTIGHLAQDLCRKLLDPQAAKRAFLLSSDYEAVLSHPFFAGFSFKSPIVGIDPNNLIESIWKNSSISNNSRGGSVSNFPQGVSSSWLEFTPEPGKAFFSGHESFYYSSLLNSPMNLPTKINRSSTPAIFPLQHEEQREPKTTTSSLPTNNNTTDCSTLDTNEKNPNPPLQRSLSQTTVHRALSKTTSNNNIPTSHDSSSEPPKRGSSADIASHSCSSSGHLTKQPCLLCSPACSITHHRDGGCSQPLTEEPLPPSVLSHAQDLPSPNLLHADRPPAPTAPTTKAGSSMNHSNLLVNNAGGVSDKEEQLVVANGPVEPIFSSKASSANVPHRTSFADASTAASQRPTGLGLDIEQNRSKQETDDFSVPSKNVSASTPQYHPRQEDNMNADLLSHAENWLAIMVSEKYREFMINEVVEGLQCILREQMTAEEYDKIDSQGMEFVKAADVLTWGPIRLTFVKFPNKVIRQPLTISPQQQFYIPDDHTNDTVPSNSIVLRQGATDSSSNAFPRSYSTGSNFLCCIRSPSYLLYNRVKRWLTPVQTPIDGIFDSGTSSDSSPRSTSPPHTYQQSSMHHYPNYYSQQATPLYNNRQSPIAPKPDIITSTSRSCTDLRLPPRPATQRQFVSASNTTTTGYGVLSAKFGLLMFEVDLVQETSTFKYMIEIQKNPFHIQKVSPHEKGDLVQQELGGANSFRGQYELIQIQFNSPMSICNRENHEKFNTQKILIDVGDASNLNYWYPHLRSFLPSTP